jgi:uncharacterized protein involved in exopolysaccharide biosynthesis
MSGHPLGDVQETAGLWQGSLPSGAVSRDLRRLKAVAWKGAPYILAWTVFLVGLGVAYATLLRPEYTSTIQILLQPRQVINDGPEDRRHVHQFVLDNQQCETELALVTSQEALRTVYRALRLSESDEVRNRFDSISSSLSALVIPTGETRTEPTDDFGFNRFESRVRARRNGLSYTLTITYRAYDPARATKVVGAIVNTYIANRLRRTRSRYADSGPYLQRRVALLREQLAIAEEGMRTGAIPQEDFREVDVRILGQPDTTLNPVYPRRNPLLATLFALGLVSGSLLFLFFTHRSGLRRNNMA